MSLPVIDVSGLEASDPAARERVGDAMRAACVDHGFLYCAGHGVPDGLTAAVMERTAAFFALPEEAKLALDKSVSSGNRGYERLGGQTLQPGAPPDRKEGFYIGREPRPGETGFNVGPNRWPTDLPGFRPTMRAYYAAMLDLAGQLMGGLALSLDLPEDHFAAFCREPEATLRLLHYPPSRPDRPDEMGAGAHTDFGGLTLLLQDVTGGLEVMGENGWIDAPPIPGTFVVNLGDMIARWTNDRYRSTLHRVVNRSGRERHSVPFFFTGNADHLVECLPTCLAPGETSIHPSIRVGDHLRAMYERTYSATR